jgi:tRNA(Ile)-lysidine synthase
VLVALSGGPDSTALLLGLLECRIPVVAAHFDHALRSESAAEALQVARLCSSLGVELISERRSAPLAPGSLQASARDARYGFLESALAKSGLNRAVLGHTADDLVESALMNLLRGSGLAGLRGMPERRGHFGRPLLECWRTEIEEYLRSRGVEPLRDPSNFDLRFARVRVRTQLLPRLELDRPGVTRRLHRVARRAAELQAEVEEGAQRLFRPGLEGLVLDALGGAGDAIRAEAFQRLHARARGRRRALDRRHLAALARLVDAGHSGDTIDLPGAICARRGYEALVMVTIAVRAPEGSMLITRPCSGCADPRAGHFLAGAKLELGARRPGLRMRPLPRGRTRKLQDILVDAKVPRHLRDSLALVFADGQLAWVPGVAVDADWASPAGSEGVHAEVVALENPLLESNHQLKESFPK